MLQRLHTLFRSWPIVCGIHSRLVLFHHGHKSYSSTIIFASLYVQSSFCNGFKEDMHALQKFTYLITSASRCCICCMPLQAVFEGQRL